MKVTERQVAQTLDRRYNVEAGNGPRYVGAAQVRSHAGFDAVRTCDYVALDLWPSKGLALHGHEIKVSRGDWLRELKEPEKSAEFMGHVDYWWLVCPAGVLQAGELPRGWGHIAIEEGRHGLTSRIATQAPRLHPVERDYSRFATGRPIARDVSRSFMAAFLRAATRQARENERAMLRVLR